MQQLNDLKRDTISGVLIIKNEEQYISRALLSLLWCDEIIVVDSFSNDHTPEICKNPTAPWASKLKFIQKTWLGFSEQRNFAMTQAQSKWIFFLDGDEQCSPELAQKITEVLADSEIQNKSVKFKIHRQEYFLSKPIHHGIWNPSYQVRLFKNGEVKFLGEVHEGVHSQCEVRKIKESIVHVEDLRIERFLTKLNYYTSLQAEQDYAGGMRTNFLKIFFAFPAMLYKNYIYYGSYKDGREGFIISVLEGISRTVRHLKIWQLQQLKDSTKFIK